MPKAIKEEKMKPIKREAGQLLFLFKDIIVYKKAFRKEWNVYVHILCR